MAVVRLASRQLELAAMTSSTSSCVFLLLIWISNVKGQYKPDWDSLDSRPLPSWYDDAKFGIFCHWGVYSVPAFRSEWMWYYWKGPNPDKDVTKFINDNYAPGTTYADFAKDFHAELFDPKEFAEIVKSSGARYFVLTSKHHEGYTMWPSPTSWNWNSVDIGPKRDIVGDLKKAFEGTGVHYGLYFSQYDWFHPLYLYDTKYSNSTFFPTLVSNPQMIEIVSQYEPEVVWSDGDWDQTDTYWKSKEFLTWLYNESPVKDKIVVNDRWGKGTMGKHGGFLTYQDHYDPGKLLSRKWENCMTLDKNSWGNRRNMKSGDVHTTHEVIEQLARTISCGGNLLLNVGPDNHGLIPAIFEDRLREIGSFMSKNEEAVYGSKPWAYQNDTNNVWYTSRQVSVGKSGNTKTVIYAWILNVPEEINLSRVSPGGNTKVTFLGTSKMFSPAKGTSLRIPSSAFPWAELPRRDVFVLKIENASPTTAFYYNPDWDSLDARPLPPWYDDVKFGIFCHWGVYSVPAYRSEWMWYYWKGPTPDNDTVNYINENYRPGTSYADFATDFVADLFDPNEFVDIVKSSGAKYFVFTSKHHEGFTMWPSPTSWNWNSVDIGPKRDVVGDLKQAFKDTDIHFGLYFSQYEWFNTLYIQDCNDNTTYYPNLISYPQMMEIVTNYEPDVVWSDGEWDQTDDYWKSKQFLAWLYNDSPVKDSVVVNDRWGHETMGHHGGFLTVADNYNPGKLIGRKWENCMSMDSMSWGNRRTMKSAEIHTVHDVLEQLASTISCGGNLLLNVGPDMHGKIPTIMEARLREVGQFLGKTGEAVYGTTPWLYQNDTNNVWYTSRQQNSKTVIYAWIIDVSEQIELSQVQATRDTKVTFLGTDVTYSPTPASTLKVPSSAYPWAKLPRTDVIILKIENGAPAVG